MEKEKSVFKYKVGRGPRAGQNPSNYMTTSIKQRTNRVSISRNFPFTAFLLEPMDRRDKRKLNTTGKAF